jgi:thymidylate synthase (FAD)
MEKQVLDKGFVRLVDNMGTDARIVQSARVSYADGTKTVRQDKGLIDFLTRHKHTSPLEQVEFTFHIKLPLFVMAQLVRHRTASLNQMSARYSIMKDEFYIPEKIRAQDTDNKQGSLEAEVENEAGLLATFQDNAVRAYQDYEHLIEQGVAREMARMVLPQNLYTEVYWNQDLHNLLHLVRLRIDDHAQWEIRQYAQALYEIIREITPWAVESWEEHVLHSTTLGRTEKEILKEMGEYNAAYFHGIVDRYVEEGKLSKGRAREIREKFKTIFE